MSLSFDRVADEYDATRGGEERGEHVAADLEPWLSGGGPVLEAGAGTGVVALAGPRSSFKPASATSTCRSRGGEVAACGSGSPDLSRIS